MVAIRGTYMTEQGFQDGDGILLVEERAVTPTRGLGLLIPYLPKNGAVDEQIGVLVDTLPADLPAGPLPSHMQGDYWLGYRAQKGLWRARDDEGASE